MPSESSIQPSDLKLKSVKAAVRGERPDAGVRLVVGASRGRKIQRKILRLCMAVDVCGCYRKSDRFGGCACALSRDDPHRLRSRVVEAVREYLPAPVHCDRADDVLPHLDTHIAHL